MYSIVTYGLTEKYNLGCPSILMGFYQLMKSVYKDFEMINLEFYKDNVPFVQSTPYTTIYVKKCSGKQQLLSVFFNIKTQGDEQGISFSDALSIVKRADVVVNLYGICFCDQLKKNKFNRLFLPLYAILDYPFSYVAKKKHIPSIKYTASYGPIKRKNTKWLARFSNRFLFDYMVAREINSLQQMHAVKADHKMIIDYDIANIMPYENIKLSCKTVGISTSYQIIRQWKNSETYIKCIADLCMHIENQYGVKVVLIPNDSHPKNKYNDIDVSKDILHEVKKEGGHVSILDVDQMTARDIKNYISSCDCMVASRYHSCVASLSSGVPLLVIGWHYKYLELLKAYGQERWLLSMDNCSSSKLQIMFDQLWIEKENCKRVIENSIPMIHDHIYETGLTIFKHKG